MENNNTIEIEELKPCPFCGSSATIKSYNYNFPENDTAYYVECSNHGCRLRTTESKAKKGISQFKFDTVTDLQAISRAVSLWNERFDDNKDKDNKDSSGIEIVVNTPKDSIPITVRKVVKHG